MTIFLALRFFGFNAVLPDTESTLLKSVWGCSLMVCVKINVRGGCWDRIVGIFNVMEQEISCVGFWTD